MNDNTMKYTLPTTAKFDLALAKLDWPLVTRDGRKARMICSDRIGKLPLVVLVTVPGDAAYECNMGYTLDGSHSPNENKSVDDILLSLADSPEYRAAVEKAQGAGYEVGKSGTRYDGEGEWFFFPPWSLTDWGDCVYALKSHLLPAPKPVAAPEPQSPVAPGHNPQKLTVEQVGEGYRLLEVGEMILPVDAYYDDRMGIWLKTHRVSMAATNTIRDGGYCYRRKLPNRPSHGASRATCPVLCAGFGPRRQLKLDGAL